MASRPLAAMDFAPKAAGSSSLISSPSPASGHRTCDEVGHPRNRESPSERAVNNPDGKCLE